MPVINGISKPAGARCLQLSPDNRCLIFGHPDRPAVCAGLSPSAAMCGESREYALTYIAWLEQQTCPDRWLIRNDAV